jgi:hypothetical protein
MEIDKPRHPEEFRDTDPQALEVWLELHRNMPRGAKFAVVFKLTNVVRETWAAEARAAHPDAGEDEVRMFVTARHLPRDLMIRAYGWDPAEHGAFEDPPPDAPERLPFESQRLDMDYVRKWAAACGVADRFQKIIRGRTPPC